MKSKKKTPNWKAWLVPIALILLGTIPGIAGTTRIVELSGGAEITQDNARFFASPLPVLLHIVGATLYAILGAFQFSRPLRLWRPRWHRIAGWLLVPSGLIAALSGLWMAHFYPWPEGDGLFLYWQRLFFGTAMLLSIVLGVVALRRKDFAQHGAWMIRGYAMGMGAGTQAFTHLPWFLFFGMPSEFTRALLMGAGWVINLAVAEWVIRKRPFRRPRSISTKLSNPIH
jgi:uncharacterized membrane protein